MTALHECVVFLLRRDDRFHARAISELAANQAQAEIVALDDRVAVVPVPDLQAGGGAVPTATP